MAKLIGVRFINSEGEPTSRQYTYSTDLDVELNSLLKVNANGKTSCVLVTNTEIDPDSLDFPIDKLKSIEEFWQGAEEADEIVFEQPSIIPIDDRIAEPCDDRIVESEDDESGDHIDG